VIIIQVYQHITTLYNALYGYHLGGTIFYFEQGYS